MFFEQAKEKGTLRIGEIGKEVFVARGRSECAAGLGENDFAARDEFGDGRQHAAKYFADGSEIVGSDPRTKFDEFRGQGGKNVEGFGDFADASAFGSAIGPFEDDADHGLAAEGDENAAANFQLRPKVLRHFVGKRSAQRNGQRDVAKELGHFECSVAALGGAARSARSCEVD